MHMDQHPQLAEQAVSSITIRLINHEEVSNLHDTGLHRLDCVATFRDQDHYCSISGLDNIEFCLSYSDGLDKDQILAKGIQKFPDPLRGLWQAAMAPAGRHTTDKHPGIEVMLLHADPIAEDGTTRKRAGGIYRNNTNGFA